MATATSRRSARPLRAASGRRAPSARTATANIAPAGRALRRPASDDEDGGDERIALDVLPPAISAANEGADETPAPRARRPRRPRSQDEDIAPAA